MKIFERVNINDMVSTWISRLNDIIDAFKLVTPTEDGLMSFKDKKFLDSIPEEYAPLRGEIPSVKTWVKTEVIPSTTEAFYINVESSNVILVEGVNNIVIDLVAGTKDVFAEKCVTFVPNDAKSYSVTLQIKNKDYATYEVKPDDNPLVLKVIFTAKEVFVREL
jgi:hypothetical protein